MPNTAHHSVLFAELDVYAQEAEALKTIDAFKRRVAELDQSIRCGAAALPSTVLYCNAAVYGTHYTVLHCTASFCAALRRLPLCSVVSLKIPERLRVGAFEVQLLHITSPH
jgi:hypothetical protein